MATNVFFDNFNNKAEQMLVEDLSIEMISMFGVDFQYLPRTTPNIDKLFLEDPTSKFTNAITLEMYIKNFEGWGGNADVMSKFGISMADTLTLCVARSRFAQEVTQRTRPMEGDLIYFSIPNAIFEIKFVEHEATLYQTGALQYYELKCERFNYSSEDIDTGMPELDIIETNYSYATDGHRLMTPNSLLLLTESGSNIIIDNFDPDDVDSTTQNQYLSQQANSIGFSVTSPFGRT